MLLRQVRPRRIALIEYAVLLVAGLALMVSVSFASGSVWLAILAASLPGALSLLSSYVNTFRVDLAELLFHAENNLKSHSFSDITAQTLLIKAQSMQQQQEKPGQSVRLIQRWQHFLGLTLSLKIHNQPHNSFECVRLTIWRCSVPVDTYRRLCVMTAWWIDQPPKVQELETV